METIVERIREFNRFYMSHMNLLGNRYVGTDYSPTEARVFFELNENEGCNAAFLVQKINIDKSYLSRILRRYERDGLLERTRSEEDGRSYHLTLTEAGKAQCQALIRKSNGEIGGIIRGLDEQDRRQLREALDTITALLEKTAEKTTAETMEKTAVEKETR